MHRGSRASKRMKAPTLPFYAKGETLEWTDGVEVFSIRMSRLYYRDRLYLADWLNKMWAMDKSFIESEE